METDRVTATEIIVVRMYLEQDKSYGDIADELKVDYFEVSEILSRPSIQSIKPNGTNEAQ